MKTNSKYVCQECGYESVRWLGRCPGCRAWSSMVEELSHRAAENTGSGSVQDPLPLSEVQTGEGSRLPTGLSEFDRVLGGGIVSGSLVLIGGDPGIGKSTLLLQTAWLAGTGCGKVLYVSGEESAQQTRMRAERLGACSENIYILPENDLDNIEVQVRKFAPGLLMVDSIQTLYNPGLPSAPGSVSQVRDCTARLMRLGKGLGIPVFIVGHVTKDGSLAGPRVLEHMVDTVLYFEGEKYNSYRLLRAIKNRFGSTNELGVFEMTDGGLREVSDAAGLFLPERKSGIPGSSVIAVMEGTRAMLVEAQALVCPTGFGTPRRLATGMDHNRLSMLLAVLEKRIGFHMSQEDVYLNIAGGIKVDEPAIDLGVALAVASSHRDIPLCCGSVFIGEIGLTGEIRSVRQIDMRLREASRLGFSRAIIPSGENRFGRIDNIEVIETGSLEDALEVALGG